MFSLSLKRATSLSAERWCKACRAMPGASSLSSLQNRSNLPSSADVVIIGGGVIGCSTLYHLTKLGITNALLIEKDELTAGTTWHTAGLVWRLRPNDVEIEILRRSRDLMRDVLLKESDIHTGWIENGGLFIASTKERLDEYKRLHTIGKVFGIDSQVLGPKETKALYPLMNVNDVYGSLYSPGDGTIDPAGYCSALTRVAMRKGAKIITKTTVTSFETKVDDFGVKRVCGVHTNAGYITTKAVVNCAGAWSRELGALAGVQVPLCAMKHAYVVTERIEGIQNMPNVRDHDSSIYLRLQGDALSIGGYEPNPIFWKPETDFAFSLFELDWDVFSVHIKSAVNRVPVVERVGIKSTVCGPESFTPDHKPLMGESAELRGFFLGCGFNSAGMMTSGGCGRELAHWVIDGRPQLDMFSYDILRFSSRLTSKTSWINERSHEAYAKNYSIVYRADEPLAARNQIRSVLHPMLAARGCVFQERHGFERPGWFTTRPATVLDYDYYGSYGYANHKDYFYADCLRQDYTFDLPLNHHIIGQEARRCRDFGAVFDMTYFGQMYLVGRDAAKAADWLFSADMRRKPGSTIYTCMLNSQGCVEADLTVSVLAPTGAECIHDDIRPTTEDGATYYLAIGGAVVEYVKGFINRELDDCRFNCRLEDRSSNLALISIQGPQSRSLLASLTDADLSDESFPFSSHRMLRVAGRACRALRLSFVGELGWELHVPVNSAPQVYEAIMRAAEPLGVCNAGYRAIDSLSSEKGYRHWHSDLRSDDTPLEAGLAFTCKLKSDVPFLGRAALEQKKNEGLKRRLICFTVNQDLMFHGLEAIWRDDAIVGFIRRAEYAYILKRPVLYGYVSRTDGGNITNDWLKAGRYEIERVGQRHEAIVHLTPPFDPLNKRVKGDYSEPLASYQL